MDFKNFHVYVKPIVLWKIEKLVEEVDAEVGGLGYARLYETSGGQHRIVIEDLAPLPHQEVSSGSVDAGSKDTSKEIERFNTLFTMPCHCDLIEGDHLVAAHANEMLFSWHSHEKHMASFSTTDLTQIEIFRHHTKMPWLLSFIMNKKGETAARLDMFRPFRLGAEVDVHTVVPNDISDWVQTELEKVTVKTTRPTTGKGQQQLPSQAGGQKKSGGKSTTISTGNGKADTDSPSSSRSLSRSESKRGHTPPTPGSKNQRKKQKRAAERARRKEEKQKQREQTESA